MWRRSLEVPGRGFHTARHAVNGAPRRRQDIAKHFAGCLHPSSVRRSGMCEQTWTRLKLRESARAFGENITARCSTTARCAVVMSSRSPAGPRIGDLPTGESGKPAPPTTASAQGKSGQSGETLFVELPLEDLRRAADRSSAYDATRVDGWDRWKFSRCSRGHPGRIAAAKRIRSKPRPKSSKDSGSRRAFRRRGIGLCRVRSTSRAFSRTIRCAAGAI